MPIHITRESLLSGILRRSMSPPRSSSTEFVSNTARQQGHSPCRCTRIIRAMEIDIFSQSPLYKLLLSGEEPTLLLNSIEHDRLYTTTLYYTSCWPNPGVQALHWLPQHQPSGSTCFETSAAEPIVSDVGVPSCLDWVYRCFCGSWKDREGDPVYLCGACRLEGHRLHRCRLGTNCPGVVIGI